MGVIDSTTTTLYCKKCSVEEKQRILDKGNMYKINQWQQYSKWDYFNCKIKDENVKNKEPSVESAKCKICNSDAEIETSS